MLRSTDVTFVCFEVSEVLDGNNSVINCDIVAADVVVGVSDIMVGMVVVCGVVVESSVSVSVDCKSAVDIVGGSFPAGKTTLNS